MRSPNLPGVRARESSSLATKILHPKRPATIPVLDNVAIYGTLLNSDWDPSKGLPRGHGTRDPGRIAAALDAVHQVVADPAHALAWQALQRAWPFTRIELFDMIWWSYIHGGQTQDR